MVENYHIIVCSHCEEHPWVQRSFNPDKRSIFALDEEDLCNAYSQQGEEEVKGQTLSNGKTAEVDGTWSDHSVVTNSENGAVSASEVNRVMSRGQSTAKHSQQSFGDLRGCGITVTHPSKATASGKLASTKGTVLKTFIICGGNAAPL